MDIGIPELLIILFVVILLFGPGRIAKTAGELGNGIRAFREGLKGEDETSQASKNDTSVPSQNNQQESAENVSGIPSKLG
jgi:sec-independent protein translocase protein TatA